MTESLSETASAAVATATGPSDLPNVPSGPALVSSGVTSASSVRLNWTVLEPGVVTERTKLGRPAPRRQVSNVPRLWFRGRVQRHQQRSSASVAGWSYPLDEPDQAIEGASYNWSARNQAIWSGPVSLLVCRVSISGSGSTR